jgi:hypothetical protein
LPRKFTCEYLEPFQQLAALFNGLRREPTGQHLRRQPSSMALKTREAGIFASTSIPVV